jgi:CRP/FNR family transcriptional regulator
MVSEENLRRLKVSHPDLKMLLKEHGEERFFEKGQELLREGQYVKVIPFVVEGVVKVMSKYAGKELLLYYIQPEESCIMSFTSALHQTPSQVFAITDTPCQLILLPTSHLADWIVSYPSLSSLFFTQYSVRYQELITSVNHLLFDSLEEKVIQYLANKIKLSGATSVLLTHREIAKDLATSREVITRVLKKLELNKKIAVGSSGISLN